MAINFNLITGDIRVPGTYVEVDNSAAVSGPQKQPYRCLIVGTSSKSADGVIRMLSNESDPTTYYGTGSDIAKSAAKFRKNNLTSELYAVSVALESSITAPTTVDKYRTFIAAAYIDDKAPDKDWSATFTIDNNVGVTGASPDPKTVKVDIKAKTKASDANIEILKAFSAAGFDVELDTYVYLYLTNQKATVADALTPSDIQNIIVIGPPDDEVFKRPGPKGNDDVVYLPIAWQDQQFILLSTGISDADFLKHVAGQLKDRASPILQADGYLITAMHGSSAELTTVSERLNTQFAAILPMRNFTSSAGETAAALMAVIASSASENPALPFQTLEVSGIELQSSSSISWTERNTLLKKGVSTYLVSPSGTLIIERIVTTYQKNTAGVEDRSYLDLNIPLILSYIIYDFRGYWQRKYARYSLADDGSKFEAGAKVMTPKLAKGEIIFKFREYEELGLVENVDALKKNLIVLRNKSDRDRLDSQVKPDLVNQLRILGMQLQYLL